MKQRLFQIVASLVIFSLYPIEPPENLTPTECGMSKQGAPPQTPLWHTYGKKGNSCDDQPSHAKTTDPSTIASSQAQTTAPLPLADGRPCPLPKTRIGSPWIDAAILVWQSKMWGLEFAGKSLLPTNEGSSAIQLQEKALVPDFAWRPGAKLDIGYDFAYDGWNLGGRWTFYRGETTHLKKHVSLGIAPEGLGVIPFWFYPFYTVLAPNEIRYTEAISSWRHYFDSIDLEVGRTSSLAKRLPMRLFAGLKGAWMHQYYRVKYEDGSSLSAIVPGIANTVPFTLLSSTMTCKNETWGAGPRAGFTSRWYLAWGFSLIADSAFSLLYSSIETKRDQNDLNLNTSDNILTPFHMDQMTHSHQLKPVVEAKVGLDFETCLFQASIIDISLAYEVQYWWGQNGLRRNYSHVTPGNMFSMRGDLQMHGLTAEAAYHY